jgi:chromate transporter
MFVLTIAQKDRFMLSLWKLFCLFFKIGLFTFGGGLAMLPLLKAEVVEKRRLLTEEELIDLYSIGQCTPGIIVVNVVTFIGYKQRGILGAVISTLAAVLPAFSIITLVASVLRHFMDNEYVIYAFAGIRVCVLALIMSMVYDLARKNIKGWYEILIFVGAVVLLVYANFSAVAVVLTTAVTVLSVGEIKRKFRK